jgi:phage terminase small subunit
MAKKLANKKREHLEPHEKTVCLEYMRNGGNQTEAFKLGFAHRAHQWLRPGTARSHASRFFAQEKVKRYLLEMQAPAVREAQITGGRILQEVARIALVDPRKLMDGDGRLLPAAAWPDEVAACVASFEVTVGPSGAEVSKVRFWDKNSALEKLMKNKGLFEADNRQRGAARIAELPPADQDALLRAIDERFGYAGEHADRGAGSSVTH